MVTKEEIDRVITFCEKVKKERGRLYAIERNPFREDVKWMYRFPLIEIDRPKEVAAKTNLVYDSVTKTLWQYLLDDWRKIEQDMKIEKK
ncbi:MAG: hypothetical protein AABX38_04920 [Candidatus Micrarchaeota archaeon]